MSGVIIPDGGTIGSVSDTDAISIASNGKSTFSQGIANAGTIDAGTIGSSVTGFTGVKEFDQWRYIADITSSAVISTDSNWERFDTDSFSQIGTGMTVSSGVFTFPSTGNYLILANVTYESNSAGVTHPRIDVELTTDNASYNSRGRASCGQQSGQVGYFISASCAVPFKVSNTSTHKIRFQTTNTSSSAKFKGRTDLNENSFTFIRVGDV